MQVVAEVYAAQDVVIKPHILLSLVLYKIVDPAQVCHSSLQTAAPLHPGIVYAAQYPHESAAQGSTATLQQCCPDSPSN